MAMKGQMRLEGMSISMFSLRIHLSLLFSDREKRSFFLGKKHLPKRKEIGKSDERAGFLGLC